jgi:hypothetical protein
MRVTVKQRSNEVKKFTLKINTPYGEFTRTTGTAYTHVVVSHPVSRCGKPIVSAAELHANLVADGNRTSGVMARVMKDRGYLVSWHASEANARKAAEKGNSAYFTTRDGEVYSL